MVSAESHTGRLRLSSGAPAGDKLFPERSPQAAGATHANVSRTTHVFRFKAKIRNKNNEVSSYAGNCLRCAKVRCS
jgi:hypothetical protein